MVVFALADREARKALVTPGPYVAAAVAFVIAAPHLIWLVRNDFLPFAYAEHRAVLPRGWYDHLWHPFEFAVSQLFFLIPSLLIAAPLFIPKRASNETAAPVADAFDRRIVAWLAFGPFATVIAMGFVSGRGAVAMWGYPLWLFLGVWLVLIAQRALERPMPRILATWGTVFGALALAFIANYAVLPRFDHRYRAVFFPGASLGREIGARFEAVTGKPLRYVIGTMWDGGNVAHYATSAPRVLVDGKPQRAPWIDLADMQAKGAVVVWTDGDRTQVPRTYRTIAPDAQVQSPLRLHYRHSDQPLDIGWAIVRPQQ
jgi:hypothetical protein